MSLADYRKATASRQVKPAVRAIWGLNGPETYHALHKPLNHLKAGTPLREIFSNGTAMHNVPIVDRKPREVITGVWSFDPAMRNFLSSCVKDWNEKVPKRMDAEGKFSIDGVHSTFDHLQAAAGYLQTPMSAKLVDNTLFRRSLGLSDKYTAAQRALAKALWMIVWSHALPSSVNVPKASAGGMPRFSHDVQWKLDYARFKTEPTNYSRFISMMEKGDVYGLANDFECVVGMYTQKRLQLDSIGKVRWANDREYALSGGARGSRVPTDKKVVIDGKEWVGFSGVRVRVIDAGPWTMNCDLQMVATSHMKAMFKQFPAVFHVNTDEQIRSVIDGKHIYCSDVSEYDQSMSGDAMSVVFETMREFYPEGIVRAAERLYEAPYYTKPLEVDGKQGWWAHSPMDWAFRMNSGNRSGHAFTSLVAKMNKVIDTLFIFAAMYPVNPENLVRWLKGLMPLGLVNNGDDEIVWALTRADLARFEKLRPDKSLGHYLVEPEPGMGFSGRLILLVDSVKMLYRTVAKLATPFEKMYVPERSIGGRLRPFWPVGWLDRIEQLNSTDQGREMWSIHNFHYERHLGKFGGWLEKVRSAYRSMNIEVGGYSAIEREVLAEPDKLHHKYTDDEVSKDVLALVTSRIPATYVAGFLRRWYSGVIM